MDRRIMRGGAALGAALFLCFCSSESPPRLVAYGPEVAPLSSGTVFLSVAQASSGTNGFIAHAVVPLERRWRKTVGIANPGDIVVTSNGLLAAIQYQSGNSFVTAAAPYAKAQSQIATKGQPISLAAQRSTIYAVELLQGAYFVQAYTAPRYKPSAISSRTRTPLGPMCALRNGTLAVGSTTGIIFMRQKGRSLQRISQMAFPAGARFAAVSSEDLVVYSAKKLVLVQPPYKKVTRVLAQTSDPIEAIAAAANGDIFVEEGPNLERYSPPAYSSPQVIAIPNLWPLSALAVDSRGDLFFATPVSGYIGASVFFVARPYTAAATGIFNSAATVQFIAFAP